MKRKNSINLFRILALTCTLILVVSPMVGPIAAQPPPGFPKLPWVGIKVIPDASVRFLSIQKGESHTDRYETEPLLIRTVEADPNLNLETARGVWLCYMEFNLHRIQDLVVRQAIAHATNRDELLYTAMLGWGIKEYSPIISEPWNPDYVNPRLKPGGDLFYEYDLAKANQMLDDAGYLDTDNDGIREIPAEKQHLYPLGTSVDNYEGTGEYREELRFTVRSLSWSFKSHKATEVLCPFISEKLGIKLDLSAEESSVMYPNCLETFNYDIFTLSTSQEPNFSGMLDLYYSEEHYAWGSNQSGFNNTRYDELWHQANALPLGSQAHKDVVFEMQELVQKEIPWISWHTADDTHVINADFTGYVVMPGGILELLNVYSLVNMYNKRDPNQGFVIAFPSDVRTTGNPLRTTDFRSKMYEVMIYDRLLAYDTELNLVPWLAEDYTISEDGLDYTFTIRDGVTWHDGTPMTAEDIAWNFEMRYDLMVANSWPFIQYIDRDSITTEGNTVKFSLKSIYTWFTLCMAGSAMMIMAPHNFDGYDDYLSWDTDNPIGSGPFMFESRVVGQSVQVVRNPNWWYTRPETIMTPTTTVTMPGTTVISTVPELAASVLLAPVALLVLASISVIRKRKPK